MTSIKNWTPLNAADLLVNNVIAARKAFKKRHINEAEYLQILLLNIGEVDPAPENDEGDPEAGEKQKPAPAPDYLSWLTPLMDAVGMFPTESAGQDSRVRSLCLRAADLQDGQDVSDFSYVVVDPDEEEPHEKFADLRLAVQAWRRSGDDSSIEVYWRDQLIPDGEWRMPLPSWVDQLLALSLEQVEEDSNDYATYSIYLNEVRRLMAKVYDVPAGFYFAVVIDQSVIYESSVLTEILSFAGQGLHKPTIWPMLAGWDGAFIKSRAEWDAAQQAKNEDCQL